MGVILNEIKDLLRRHSPEFWGKLKQQTLDATTFSELFLLSSLRKKALALGIEHEGAAKTPLRLAILGGYNLYPLHELVSHYLESNGVTCELFLGDYDNYVAEMTEVDGALYQFRPQVVLVLPGLQRCRYAGAIGDSREIVQVAANTLATQLLGLCRTVHEQTGAEVLLGNFMLPARYDLGELRSRSLGTDWNFRKCVNLEMGLTAPPFVRILDIEFLANRHGALASEDSRGWFESKQFCAPSLLFEVCREVAHLIFGLRATPKKVLVLDLDNTLWGGVLGDDGLEGIEIGDTSPRGEAFKAFQKYIVSLKDRGVLLAVSSKNDERRAIEPFEKHPEMVLRLDDFVSFKANWDPKSENIRQMAAELGLGIDSFVFVDDNPAEIEIVRQFVPEVTTILLGSSAADYAGQLQDCRLFEPRSITVEDAQRTDQYLAERKRQDLLASATDMPAYLESLGMEAAICEFNQMDVPRLAQLINKSNQFNLTTRRRTEAEVQSLINQEDWICLSVRLQDRFGDHGLVSIVVGQARSEAVYIDTWLMSCRVLKRQVEDAVLNELCRQAQDRGHSRLEGVYLPTAKNEMVRDFYSRMGFQTKSIAPDRADFVLELGSFCPRPTKINVRSTT
ncbi:HAD-IIIC family phosphatase [Schlesneria paludicola]|uniref:HAD-IIIC family phosphatase n=1 Tax=Schlesneria paludicola TaxID=360056 RepID=UPI0002E520AC|nr:HAD-IIIC family phosphatase [Schlesneria paludicola]